MKRLLNEKGSSLALVLVVLLFFTTLSLAMIPATQVSYKSAADQQLSQQAYFTARSAVDTMFSYLNKNPAQLSTMLISTGRPTDTTNGDFDVTIQPDVSTSGQYTITGTGYYPNRNNALKKTSVVVAHIVQSASGPLPTDNIIYQNGDLTSFNCNVTGDIFVNGKFTLSSGDSLTGKIIAMNDITLNGGTSTIGGGIYTKGSISLSGGTNVTSNCFCDGPFSISGGSNLKGNVVTNSTFTNYGNNLRGNVTSFSNAIFDGGGNSLTGSLNAGGIFSIPSWATISTFVSGTALQYQKVTKYDFSSYNPLSVPFVTVPDNIKNLSSIPTTVTLINKSGAVNSDNFNNSDVIIDTSGGDINLLINSSVSIHNSKVLVKGQNNVYIYLYGSSASLSLTGGNPTLAMQSNVDANSNIYILGDGSQNVSVGSGALRATIYIPKGEFDVSGSDISESSFSPTGNDPIPSTSNAYLFRGSAVVMSSNLLGNVHIKYVKPNNSVITTLIPGLGSGSGGSGFTIVSWSKS
jgi:type II secretory pathway pseudopilin PulG